MLIRKPRHGFGRSPLHRRASPDQLRHDVMTGAVGCAATTSTWLALVMTLRTEGRVPITGALVAQLLIVAAMAVLVLGSTLAIAGDHRGRLCTVGLLIASAGSFAAALAPDRGGLLIAALVTTVGTAAVVGAEHRGRVGLVAVLWSQAVVLAVVVLAVAVAPTVGRGPVLLGSGAACALAAVVARPRLTSTPRAQRSEPPWNRRTLGLLVGGWLCCTGSYTACAHLLNTGPTLVVTAWVSGTWSLAAITIRLALRYLGPFFTASAGALAPGAGRRCSARSPDPGGKSDGQRCSHRRRSLRARRRQPTNAAMARGRAAQQLSTSPYGTDRSLASALSENGDSR